MIVAGGHDLIIVLGIEAQPLNSLAVGLFRKIEVSHHPIQHVLLMIVLRLLTIRFDPRVDDGFDVSVALGVVGDKQPEVLRVGREPQRNNVFVV